MKSFSDFPYVETAALPDPQSRGVEWISFRTILYTPLLDRISPVLELNGKDGA